MNIQKLANDVFNEEADALEAFAQMKEYKKIFDECFKAIEASAQEEASNYDKNFEHKGYKFEQREGGKLWKYDHIPTWKELKNKLSELEAKAKASAQSFGENLATVDGETGEIIERAIFTVKKGSIIVKKIQEHQNK